MIRESENSCYITAAAARPVYTHGMEGYISQGSFESEPDIMAEHVINQASHTANSSSFVFKLYFVNYVYSIGVKEIIFLTRFILLRAAMNRHTQLDRECNQK